MQSAYITALITVMVSVLTVGALHAQQREVSVYGYIDLEYEYSTTKKMSTFDIHHFNMLSTYSFRQFRIFSELEWEHGPEMEGGSGQGEIALERAWFEYTHNDRLKLRGGKFLSPFGIYNLIHDATPTFLTTSLPLIYQKHQPFGANIDRLYAKFYVGLQALGSVAAGSDTRFEYTLGLGNGRGSESFSDDNDNNKAITARAVVQPAENMRFGASFYGDRNELGLSGRSRSREQAYGIDLEFDNDQIQMQTEYVRFRLQKNGVDDSFQIAHSYYGQLAYTIAGHFTPILRYDYFDPNVGLGNDSYRYWLIGLNVSPDSNVYFKAEVQFKDFENPSVASSRLFLSSIAVAF